jgi:hypothetical protein
MPTKYPTNLIVLIITPCPWAASELYLPSDHCLSAKLVPAFADRGVLRNQRNESPRPYSRLSRPEQLQFSSKLLLSCTHKVE